ncbi:MAG TPA: phage terminase large subunit [Roseomonas sp.]|nr:phage terminase large subunit [Roseomonas sp.]
MTKPKGKPTPGLGPLEDFRNFVFLVWKHLNLPDPTPVQYDICEYLQHGPDRQMIQAFRGVGKSYITSAFTAWELLRDPDQKIMAVSASKDRADQFSTFVKRLIEDMPILAPLRSRPEQRNSNLAFDVGPARPDHSPSVKSVGIFGQLTGSRANIIIADDVEVPNNSETQTMRDKLAERVKEFDAVLKPGGRVVYLGTPQTELTLYGLLRQRGYETRIWPARFPTPAQARSYGDDLAPMILRGLDKGSRAGASTDPKRFDDEDLAKRELSYGKAGFALQFMLDPKLSDVDRYPLKTSDLIVMSCPPNEAPGKVTWGSMPELALPDLPNVGLSGDKWYRPWRTSDDPREWAPYQGTVMFIDPAGGGADEASYAALSFLNGNLFLRDVGGFMHGYAPATLQGFADAAKAHNVNLVLVEDNFGDGMFRELLKPYLAKTHPCGVEGVKHTRQKELRIIDTLAPVLAQHRLIVDPRVIEKDYRSVESYSSDTKHAYRLFHQLTRITRDKGALKQDGRLDALAGAVAYFAERMARDQEKAAEELREEALRKELEKFIEACGGRTSVGPMWVRT